MRKIISTVLVLFSLLTAQAAQADIRVTDVEGRSISLPAPAERVLLGFNFEDFLAIVGPGAMERVVAVSRAPWKEWRPKQYEAYVAAIPSIIGLIDVGDIESGTFSVEAAVGARPDLIILAAWQYRALGAIAEKLEAAGIPIVVIDYNAQTVEKYVASTLVIGQVMGAEDCARHLAEAYQVAVADTLERVRRAGPAVA